MEIKSKHKKVIFKNLQVGDVFMKIGGFGEVCMRTNIASKVSKVPQNGNIDFNCVRLSGGFLDHIDDNTEVLKLKATVEYIYE